MAQNAFRRSLSEGEPLGLVLVSLDNPPTDEVFDGVAAELKERPAAERELARAVRRFGGS